MILLDPLRFHNLTGLFFNTNTPLLRKQIFTFGFYKTRQLKIIYVRQQSHTGKRRVVLFS